MANNIISDTKKSINGAGDYIKDNAPEHLSKMVYDSGEKIGAVASDLANSALDSIKSSRDYVKENPYKGVAYAAAAGLLVGALLGGLFSRSRD